jgi:hypothetical protein
VEPLFSRIVSRVLPTRPALTGASIAMASVVAQAIDADQILVQNVGNLAIKPQFGQSTVYSDNIFYGNDSIFLPGTGPGTAFAGIPIRPQEDDLVVTISPGLKLQYGTDASNLITFEYALDEVFYTGHSDYQPQQHHLDLRTKFQKGKFLITGTDSLEFLSSFLGGGTFVDPTLSRAQDFLLDRRQTALDHKVTFDYSEKTDVYGDFQFSETDFESATSLLDMNTLRGSFGGTYKFSPKLGVFTEGFYGQTAVSQNRSNPGMPGGAHSQFYGGFVGVRGELTPKIAGSVKAGYEVREFPSQGGAGTDAPAFDIALDYAAGPKTSLALSYSRRTSSSVQFANQAFVFDNVSISVNQYVGSAGKWILNGAVRYGGASFDELNTGGAVYPQRQDNTISFNTAVAFQPRPWCTFSLGYDFEHFSTDGVFFANADVNRIRPLDYLVDYQVHTAFLKISIGY